MAISITDLLQRSELFSGLTPEQIEQIAALGQEVVYNAGDVIIHEGDPSDEMYIIRSGMVEVLVSCGHRDGHRHGPHSAQRSLRHRADHGQSVRGEDGREGRRGSVQSARAASSARWCSWERWWPWRPGGLSGTNWPPGCGRPGSSSSRFSRSWS
nr:cyclic nucleotide-binding domain-containing protein [Anaerolineae bacterium]